MVTSSESVRVDVWVNVLVRDSSRETCSVGLPKDVVGVAVMELVALHDCDEPALLLIVSDLLTAFDEEFVGVWNIVMR